LLAIIQIVRLHAYFPKPRSSILKFLEWYEINRLRYLCSIVKDLSEVRQLITERVSDDAMRRQLLQLAGTSPQTWRGCSRMDVVPVLQTDLAQKQHRAAAKPMPAQAPAAPAQGYHLTQTMHSTPGVHLQSSIPTPFKTTTPAPAQTTLF
jgi:hypothetical protein